MRLKQPAKRGQGSPRSESPAAFCYRFDRRFIYAPCINAVPLPLRPPRLDRWEPYAWLAIVANQDVALNTHQS